MGRWWPLRPGAGGPAAHAPPCSSSCRAPRVTPGPFAGAGATPGRRTGHAVGRYTRSSAAVRRTGRKHHAQHHAGRAAPDQRHPPSRPAGLRHEPGRDHHRARRPSRSRPAFAEVARRAEQLATALGRLGVGDSDRVGDLPVEQPDPPGGLPGRPGHGCGAPHPQPPALPRAAGLRHQPRRGPGHHLRRLHRRPAGPGPRPDPDRPPHRHRGGGGHLRPRRDPGLRGAAGRRGARATTGRGSTNARPRPCATRRAPPATRRAWSTATGRRSCTRWPSPSGSSLGISERDSVLSIVPMFHANAWGTPYGGVPDRRRPDHAPAVPPGRPAGGHHRPLPPDRVGRGAHHLERPAALHPDQPGRPVQPADDHRRRRRGAPPAHRAVPGRARRGDGPGLGHDRDQPAVRAGHPAPPRRPGRGDRVAGQDRSDRARRRGADLRGRRHGPPQRRRGGGGVRGPGPVDHRLVLRRPVTRPLPRRLAAHRRHRVARPARLHADQRPEQGRHQVGWRVDLVGRAGERGHGPSPRSSRPR